MAIYAIGDVQGCYDQLCRLLEKIKFDQSIDSLWFCGDLVNRGGQSLAVLRFVKSLGAGAISVLGNHDLHLLAIFHGAGGVPRDDSLFELLDSPDRDELMRWLQARPMLHYDAVLDTLLVHAGIHPDWSLEDARRLAQQLEAVVRAEGGDFFRQMYGDEPDHWDESLKGMARWRSITNILTRLRFIAGDGKLNFTAKGSPQQHAAEGLRPWFESDLALAGRTRVLFGHWSTLEVGCHGRALALDSGCVWGGRLTALRVDSDVPQWFSCACPG